MIMGQGKATVVGPLLALILGDGKQLVTQVVPQALLDFNRGCMRSIFSSLVTKPVYTFQFNRFQKVDPAMYRKLLKARERRAVVVASPTSIKSFSLKFIEVLHNLDRIKNEELAEQSGGSQASKSSSGGGIMGALGLGSKAKERRNMMEERAAEARSLRSQAAECVKVLQLFREGSLLLDEVDLILHPLKSELNWHGKKEALDFTRSKIGPGLRFEIPYHLLDALFYAVEGKLVVPSSPCHSSSSSSSSSSSQSALAAEDLDSRAPTWGAGMEIWPLQLIEFGDEEQIQILYDLLHKLPHMSYYYLMNFIFPPVLRHQGLKLSASGQALGGDMLFQKRLGFSGTPSDLLPLELGKCQYEKGSDGKMLHYLSSPDIMSYELLENDWSVTSLLERIAKADPPVHALIDTGALITGMTNLQVAQFLMAKEDRLPQMEGVVFLDSLDRNMILVRTSMKVMPLDQSGIERAKRFSFYDQVHTTGMDIKQALNACGRRDRAPRGRAAARMPQRTWRRRA